MAFVEVHFKSDALGLCCSANVILPDSKDRAQTRCVPVVYLLHGLSDDHTVWMRRTSIERHAEALAPGFAVVMPAVDRSYYTDMKRGNNYWTYVSEELPAIMGSMFPLSARREDTFVAGLSMGGYGALKLALNHPQRFLACASLSGACEMGSHIRNHQDPKFLQDAENIFGAIEEFEHSVNDLAWQAECVARQGGCPDLFMACGTEDFLYENNVRFRDHLRALGLPVLWEATPGRAHTWDYWDEQIQVALHRFAQLRAKALQD